MGMNGKVGRAKELSRIRNSRMARAKAAGVDTTDRAAMKAFKDQEFRNLMASLDEQIAANRAAK